MSASKTDSPLPFDRLAWRRHRDRVARQGSVDFLHREAAERLIERLEDIERPFPAVLDLGARDGRLLAALAARPGTEQTVAAEPSPVFLARLPNPEQVLRVAADPELLPFRTARFDLIVSNLVLHWVGDLPGALVQVRRALKPDGLFLAALLGGRTLIELRNVLIEAELAEEGGASPRVSPAIDLADAAALLQRTGFASPVADADLLTVTYPDALALMRDLRGMGETNALRARRRTPLRRATLLRALALYSERFGLPDGRIPASFELLFLTGRAPR